MNDVTLALITAFFFAVFASFIYALADTFGHRLDVHYGPGFRLRIGRRTDDHPVPPSR